MTHFIGAVIVPADTNIAHTTYMKQSFFQNYQETTPNAQLQATLERILDKFDENKDTPRYVSYTKEQLIEKGKKDIEDYRTGLYAKYLEDPAKYAENSHDGHLNYISTEFPKKLQWTREQIYQDAIEWEDEDNIGPDGEVYSTYNPHSKWDWWTVGGRWTEQFEKRQGETVADFIKAVEADQQALKDGVRLRPEANAEDDWLAEPDRKLPWWFPKNIVVEQGGESEWIAQGRVGWFGTFDDEGTSEEAWLKQALAVLKAQDQNAKVFYIDFHI